MGDAEAINPIFERHRGKEFLTYASAMATLNP